MKSLLKNVIISLLIITFAIIVYYLFISSRPIATAKQESVSLPIVNISKRDSVKIIKIGENIKNCEYIKKCDLIFKIDSFYIENEIKEKLASREILMLKLKNVNSQINTTGLKKKEIIIQRDIIKNQLNRRTSVKSKVFSDNTLDELR